MIVSRSVSFTRAASFVFCALLWAVPAQAGTFKLNGTDAYALIPGGGTGLQFPGTAPFTIEAWIRPASTGTFQVILSKYNAGVAGEYYVALNTNGQIYVHREVGPNWAIASTGTVAPDVWTHVAVTYTNNTRRVYLNGELDPMVDPGSGAVSPKTTQVLIGAYYNVNNPARYFNGDIDEVRVWNVARSQSEIQQDMRRHLTGLEPGLMAYYPVDESAGLISPDRSPNRFDATSLLGGLVRNLAEDAVAPVPLIRPAASITGNSALLNGWITTNSAPAAGFFQWGPGSTALRFDGVNDLATVAHDPQLNAYPLTVTAWVKVAPGARGGVIDKYVGGSGNGWRLTVNTGQIIGLYYKSLSEYIASANGSGATSVPIDDNQWHHIAFTVGDSGGAIYVDGALSGTAAWVNGPGAPTSTENLKFGYGAGLNLNAELDDVAVWNAELDASEIASLIAAGQTVGHPQYTNVVGHWDFETGADGGAPDVSGHGHDAIFFGDPVRISQSRPALTMQTASGPVLGSNAVLNLDGFDDYVAVPEGTWFSGDFTIEFWAFVRKYSRYGRFLDFGNGAGQDNVLLSLSSAGGQLQLWMYPGDSVVSLSSPMPVPQNEWVHLAATLQGSNVTIYFNGAEVARRTAPAPQAVTRTLNFIGRPNWTSETHADALMDEVRIWNVARTAEQLRQFSTQPVDPADPTLLLNYRFDESGGDVAIDSRTISPQNGTLRNGADRLPLASQTEALAGLSPGTRYFARTGVQDTNGVIFSAITGFATPAPGRGTALEFDGKTDLVTEDLPQLPAGNSPYTIEAWIKPNVMNAGGIVGWGNYGANNQVNAFRLYPGGLHNYWWYNDLSAPVGDLTDRWHHVAVTYDGTVRKIFVDGVVRAAANATGHNVTTTANFAIGKTVNQEYFDGRIDEVRIWNIARTETDIAQYMNERLQGDETGLVLYTRLDEGTGFTTGDDSVNGSELMLVGRPDWTGSDAAVGVPVATTLAASGVGFGSATFNGAVNLEGTSSARYWFEVEVAGAFTAATPERILEPGVALVNVSEVVTNLGISADYSFRLVAANDNCTNVSDALNFVMPVPAARTALSFDGVNDQVVVSSSSAYKATTNLTVEAWIYPVDPAHPAGGIIVNKEGEYEFARFPDGTLRWALAFNSANWYWTNTTVVAAPEQWMHVAFVYDRTSMTTYTNGQVASVQPATGNILDSITTQNELRIGGRQGTSQFWTGQLDDVRVWLVARSAAEIQASYNRRLIPPQPGLAALFEFNEGMGLSTSNLANNTTASLSGGAAWVASGAGIIDPIVNTLAPTPVLATSATLRGSVNPSGEGVVTYFEYGPTIAYGSATATVNYPASLATLQHSAMLSGLEPGTTYHYRMVAYNTVQTNYGANQSFTTLVLGSGWPVSTKLTGGEASLPLHVMDGLGNAYVAGVFSGSAAFRSPLSPSGGAVANAFVGKMSRTADWLWAANIPASSNGFTRIKAVALDAERNVYVAGQFAGTNTFGQTQLVTTGDTNLFVAKLGSFGTNWLWARAIGGAGADSANAMTVVGTNVVLAGDFSGTADFTVTNLVSAGASDVFVAALDLDGTWFWANRGGGTGNASAKTLATDGNGNIYVAGDFAGTATFQNTVLTNAGGTDLFVAKLTPGGTWVLARRGGSVNNDTAAALARGSGNQFYLAGQFGATADYGGTVNNLNVGSASNIFVLRLNTEALYLDYTQGGAGHARSVTVDSLDRVYVGGDFTFTTLFGTNSLISSGNSDVFIAQMIAGDWTWAQKIGSAGIETAGSISADADNTVVISGTYQGTIQIGYVALTSPNNQDIFVARFDAGRVYEHNNYIVGQAIPVPVDAQDPAYGDGAIDLPIITILEKDRADSDALNSFVWSVAEHKLYPVRQVTAILKWPLTENVGTNTSAVVTAVGRIAYPTNPVIHVANAPVDLEPVVPGFPLKFANLSFTTINGAGVDASTKRFTAPAPGWSVLQFLNTGGELPNPAIHPSRFEVVRTVDWNDPQYLLDNVPAEIGKALAHPTHADPTGKNGFVYFETAFYDGAGDERAYDRTSREGPIIPVNKDTASASDDLVIVWYRISENGIAWPARPVRYLAEWPADSAELVLASRLGSGALGAPDYPSKRVYNQPDRALPGFNPNEEHAALFGDVLFALRNDLNNVISPKASEPYTLLKYIDPASGQWTMKVFKVVATNAIYQFTYGAVAGSDLPLPEPLGFLTLCNFSNRVVAGPGFQDYAGRLYARAAGLGTTGTNIVTRYWYPLQAGFFYDLNSDGAPDVPAGTCVAWLDRRSGGVAGTPVDITYNVTWPSDVPTLQIGETLLNARFGLPDIRNFASAAVIYDEANPYGTNAPESLVRLFDPLSERTVELSSEFSLPPEIQTANDAGRLVFSELPYVLRSRLRYDDLNKRLSFAGVLDQSVAYGGPDNPLLLINVLSPRERERIKQLSSAPAFIQAIDDLYHLTRNPNRLDLDGNGTPDQRLLIGLTYGYQTNSTTGVILTNVVPESLDDRPKALTAGLGAGQGYVTVVENDSSALSGLPVRLHVIRVAQGPYRGDIKVLYPDNVFDEKLTLRHSADFGGEPQRFEFEWYYKPDEPGFDRTDLPVVSSAGAIADLRGWTVFPGVPPGVNGFNDITIGDGGQASLLTLADNWFVCRYRGYNIGEQTNVWSDWVGVIGGGEAQLAEGWVKRVIFGLNPFEARTDDFHENETATFASMLQQAGARYEGDIAFNPSGDNLNSIGLIQAYQTVLHRAKRLSIDAVPGINFAPANNALLLAAGRIADFYMLLGNEAYADAADPTIGFRTDAAGYGTLAPSIFTFQNQLDSLLEEELTLLRGRDDRSATVRSAPIYNRLFWNFTHDEGEVAYAQAYNITDQNADGFIDADDARIMYPQGHGDAWGHYLTAIKAYYELLRNQNFDWIPRSESILLAGVPVQVDYLDERKFARAAAAKARTGAEIVNLSYRLNYVDDPAGQYQGYKDTDAGRAWGLSEWAHRAGSGAFFDWVTANAVLPAEDPDPNHTGITKIDRTTVRELDEINAGYESIQAQIDKADQGLNPLGLARNVVPFDIDPSQIDNGQTHFEQIYARAIEALKNTVTVFDHANQLSQSLRSLQDNVNQFSQNVDQQERDYKNRLIEIFGYPYAGDIGAGRTYPSGYDGPDLYHYMYVNSTELGDTAPPSETFTGFFTNANFGIDTRGFYFPEDAPTAPASGSNLLAVSYPLSSSEYAFKAPAAWGQRRAPGEIQLALSAMLQNESRLKQARLNYDNLVFAIQGKIDLLQARYDLRAETLDIEDRKNVKKALLSAGVATAKITQDVLARSIYKIEKSGEIAIEGVPRSVGFSPDVFSMVRAAVRSSVFVGTTALEVGKGLATLAEHGFAAGKEIAENQAQLAISTAGFNYEVQQHIKELEELLRKEALLRVEAYALVNTLDQSIGEYQAALARGLRLAEERVAFRKNAAAETQASRYQDMTFRIFRNDAIQKYRAQFDLTAQYVYLAAVAYDFETQLLGDRPGAGRAFLTDVVRQRAIGQVQNGTPVAGRHGLADPLARLSLNFGVLKGQLGFNNPQTETGRFSLRSELLRLRDSSNEEWRAVLKQSIVPNLWDVPEFRRYCRPFAPESAGAQPGLVIRFPTTITFGLNYFGWPLGGGDNAYDPTLFATKVRSAGVWFEDYLGSGLSLTPRVYLVPAGADVLRSPSGNDLQTREWRVVDQKIPVPFPVGFSSLNSSTWIPINDSLSDTFADIRRFSSFRAYHDSGAFNPAETSTDSRLIGRSVWNTDWMLIIPGGTFLFDPDQGLETFINSVSDIKIFFQTYAYSGN